MLRRKPRPHTGTGVEPRQATLLCVPCAAGDGRGWLEQAGMLELRRCDLRLLLRLGPSQTPPPCPAPSQMLSLARRLHRIPTGGALTCALCNSRKPGCGQPPHMHTHALTQRTHARTPPRRHEACAGGWALGQADVRQLEAGKGSRGGKRVRQFPSLHGRVAAVSPVVRLRKAAFFFIELRQRLPETRPADASVWRRSSGAHCTRELSVFILCRHAALLRWHPVLSDSGVCGPAPLSPHATTQRVLITRLRAVSAGSAGADTSHRHRHRHRSRSSSRSHGARHVSQGARRARRSQHIVLETAADSTLFLLPAPPRPANSGSSASARSASVAAASVAAEPAKRTAAAAPNRGERAVVANRGGGNASGSVGGSGSARASLMSYEGTIRARLSHRVFELDCGLCVAPNHRRRRMSSVPFAWHLHVRVCWYSKARRLAALPPRHP